MILIFQGLSNLTGSLKYFFNIIDMCAITVLPQVQTICLYGSYIYICKYQSEPPPANMILIVSVEFQAYQELDEFI